MDDHTETAAAGDSAKTQSSLPTAFSKYASVIHRSSKTTGVPEQLEL
jgi:hypothetical protein